MKKTGTEFTDSKEIAAILDTATNEDGIRMFKVAWKDTWLTMQQLGTYEHKIEQILSGFTSPRNKKRKTASNYDDDASNCTVNMVTVPLQKTASRYHRTGSNLKHKPVFNLENIVSKLKETKKKKYNYWEEYFDSRKEIGHDSKNHCSDGKHVESPNNWKAFVSKDSHNVSSNVSDNDKETDFSDGESEEKSSFLTELEERDQEMYYNASDKISEKTEIDEKLPMNFRMSVKDVQLKRLIAERELVENYNENDIIDKISETKCEKCNKKFYRRSQLIRHLSNHVVHECQKCNAIFYCVRKYKRHIVQHESYPCDFCEEEFCDASAWYKHRAKHTMVECSSCQTAFYSHSALAKHRLQHMQYVCPLCNATFSGLTYWLSHRIYHGKRFDNILLAPIIKCRECYGGFSTQDEFGKHVCLYGKKFAGRTRKRLLTKMEISDLIGVDETARTV